MTDLDTLLAGPPFLGYAYSYPHKSAYRPLDPPVPLADAWAESPGDAALYVHIPFCEMRCGFCNLFTTAHPAEGVEGRTIDALERQASVVREAVGVRRIPRVAIGGGTPTYLTESHLARVLALIADFAPEPNAPFSVETSPGTATDEKLALLRAAGVDRVSVGVQSFVDDEVRASGRGQSAAQVEVALGRVRAAGFPILNLDLIYGLPGQSEASWDFSLNAALAWRPEELYLYPLYVRPLTGLDGRAQSAATLALYRQARTRLLASGYEQASLRFFRKTGAPSHPSSDATDGNLIGLGCGARSYTRRLHYSSEFAVGRRGVRSIVDAWCDRTDDAFSRADHGVRLTDDEAWRRKVVYGLLQQADGTPDDALDALPQLAELIQRGLAVHTGGRLQLTESGWERADVLGPWLTSPAMRHRMETFSLR